MLPVVKKILYATDLSETSKHAMGYAISIAKEHGAEVTVLHVLPDFNNEFSMTSGLEFTAVYDADTWKAFSDAGFDKARNAIMDRMGEMCAEVSGNGDVCPLNKDNILVVSGNAVDAIVDYGRNADLIIMGTHGHGRIGGLLVGSVAQGVLSKSTTPVMVVRLDE